MRVIKLSLVSACIATGALGIAGCGGDDNETTATTTTGAASGGGQTVNISETEYKLDPSDPTVQAGTVSFKATNDGSITHSLEVEGPNGEQKLQPDLAPGQSGTLTVDLSQPGKYEFYCPIDSHRERGMEGEITVSGAGGASGGGGAASGGGSEAGGSGASAGGGSQTDDGGTSSGGGGYGY
jgi:uncharacterized cupredoxin-like copper-binding protein